MLNSIDWASIPRNTLFTDFFTIYCRTMNDEIIQSRLVSARDIGSVKLTKEMRGFAEPRNQVVANPKRQRDESQNLCKAARAAGYNAIAVRCPGCGSAQHGFAACDNRDHPQFSKETFAFVDSKKGTKKWF